MPDLFADVKVGDEVCQYFIANQGEYVYKAGVVTAVMPERFVVDGVVYRKSNGSAIDQGAYWDYVCPMTEAIRACIKSRQIQRRAELLHLLKR